MLCLGDIVLESHCIRIHSGRSLQFIIGHVVHNLQQVTSDLILRICVDKSQEVVVCCSIQVVNQSAHKRDVIFSGSRSQEGEVNHGPLLGWKTLESALDIVDQVEYLPVLVKYVPDLLND